jgi:chromate transporter
MAESKLPSLPELALTFSRISLVSFGGGQMPAIRREVVRRARWLDDETYLELLSLAQLLPGSNPTNIAVLIGSRMRGAAGATVSLLGMVLPGFIVLMVLGAFALESHQPWVQGALRGCAAMAVGLTLATSIEMTAKRIRVVDLAIIAGVAATVLLLHASLVVTLIVFIPIALLLTRPKAKAEAKAPA